MPLVYLSPSTQEFNFFVNNGTEEEWMNAITDEIENYLTAGGISFIRNTPDMTARTSIEQSNAAGVDLHVAIHSNSSPDILKGLLTGPDIYYAPVSRNGYRMARILEENFKEIYPDESKVDIREADYLGEVLLTNAPAVLIETAYHDNIDDALWIQNNVSEIARAIAKSIYEYFGIPFIYGNETDF